MFRFTLNKLNQLHKRTGFVFLALACLCVVIALFLTTLASWRLDSIAKTGLMSVSIGNNGNNVGLLGSGIDLSSIPTTNLLKDPSFEPNVFREVFTVEDGDKNTLVVSNKQAKPGVYGAGFFVGADIRVNTNNKAGILLRKTGKVVRYEPNQIGEFQKSPTIGDIPLNAKIKDYTTKEKISITVGEKGIIIKGINTQSPALQNVDTLAEFTSVTHNDTNFFACTSDGMVISSEDGEKWTQWKTPFPGELTGIAASPTTVVAVGKNGLVMTGSEGILYLKEIGLDENITDITYGNNQFVAVTDKGNIIISPNGILWSKRSQPNASAYLKIEYADTLFALLTQSKTVQIYTNIEETPIVTNQTPLSGVADVTIMSKSKILVLNDKNQIYQSNDQGKTWNESKILPPLGSSLIGAIGDEEILCTSLVTNSYISRLVTEIEVDSELKEGTYQAGDLCYIDIEYPVLPANYLETSQAASLENQWEFYGNGLAEKIIGEGAPYSGVGIMKLTSQNLFATNISHATISQKITRTISEEKLTPSTFYNFHMWVRQENITNGAVKVWISGPFDSIGMEFSNIGTTWKKVTFKFLIPPSVTAGQLAEARFNIGTTDQGIFYFDNAYLGLTSENEEVIPIAYLNELKTINPAWVRLNFMGVGTINDMPNRWAHNGEMEKSLKLVYDSGTNTNPWIVIDSHIGESELRNLIEYLSGPISTVYGKFRMENGSTLPWSDQFDRILIEFIDSNDYLSNDASKAVYINESMKIIESSPYYKNIKNKVVFVDGMQYVEGLMLSRADYSASAFTCEISQERTDSIRQALTEYSTLIPRNPDRPTNLPINLLRSTYFKKSDYVPETGEIVTVLLDRLGIDVNASMQTLPDWNTPQWTKVQTSAAMIAGKAARGSKLDVTMTQVTAMQSLVDSYAFKDNNKVYLVFSSHNKNPVAISVETAYSFQGGNLTRFDSNGEIVEQTKLKKADQKFNIMPGNVMLFELIAN